jgi:predicted SprT family Zn-dependent metalloprotease
MHVFYKNELKEVSRETEKTFFFKSGGKALKTSCKMLNKTKEQTATKPLQKTQTTTNNNLEKAQNLIEELLSKTINHPYGNTNLKLCGWFFKGFDRGIKRAGLCSYGSKGKFISISKKLTLQREWENTKNTILHEIAHALDVEYRRTSAHDEIWRNIHISIGGTGETRWNSEKENITQDYKYIGICKKCGKVAGKWVRKPKYTHDGAYTHKNCGGNIKVQTTNN